MQKWKQEAEALRLWKGKQEAEALRLWKRKQDCYLEAEALNSSYFRITGRQCVVQLQSNNV